MGVLFDLKCDLERLKESLEKTERDVNEVLKEIMSLDKATLLLN